MDLPMDLNLPPAHEERVICSISAALEYEIPADLLLAVAEVEGGRPGQRVRNRNGSHDIGSMQINTGYLADLKHYGITPEDAALPGCYPYKLAAWRIKGHLKNDKGDIWTRAANYHSRTPEYNKAYRIKIKTAAKRWAGWLKSKFKTHSYQAQIGGKGSL